MHLLPPEIWGHIFRYILSPPSSSPSSEDKAAQRLGEREAQGDLSRISSTHSSWRGEAQRVLFDRVILHSIKSLEALEIAAGGDWERLGGLIRSFEMDFRSDGTFFGSRRGAEGKEWSIGGIMGRELPNLARWTFVPTFERFADDLSLALQARPFLPSLTKLSVFVSVYQPWPHSVVMDLLATAPNLVELEIVGSVDLRSIPLDGPTVVNLDALRILHLQVSGSLPFIGGRAIHLDSFHHLEHLRIDYSDDATHTELGEFFRVVQDSLLSLSSWTSHLISRHLLNLHALTYLLLHRISPGDIYFFSLLPPSLECLELRELGDGFTNALETLVIRPPTAYFALRVQDADPRIPWTLLPPLKTLTIVRVDRPASLYFHRRGEAFAFAGWFKQAQLAGGEVPVRRLLLGETLYRAVRHLIAPYAEKMGIELGQLIE